ARMSCSPLVNQPVISILPLIMVMYSTAHFPWAGHYRPCNHLRLGSGWEVTMTAMTSSTRGIPAEVVDYLRRHHVITLSTSPFTGMPHADTVVYVSDQHSIFFFAGDGTKMLRNIKDNRYVSFTVDDYTVDWRKVRELQGVGRCQSVPEEHDAAAWSMY